MKKVITYGTYDLLHYGHKKILERAKALGDYLIVGVTADDFDISRGKINVYQSLAERIAGVQSLGIADQIIVEEYEGQKIDDIQKYGIDIFAIGSDWKGAFDYIKEYCDVVYLPRTEGISSSLIRSNSDPIKLGIVGDSIYLQKVLTEVKFVNGIEVVGIFTGKSKDEKTFGSDYCYFDNYIELLHICDAVYIHSVPQLHYEQAKQALVNHCHVLCEAPICLSLNELQKLYDLSKKKKKIILEAIRTAYSTAYNRLVLLIQSGKIGQPVMIQSTCTSMKNIEKMLEQNSENKPWTSITDWGPTALLPALQIMGTDYINCSFITKFEDINKEYDSFSRIELLYNHSIASIIVGTGIKSEGELIISGTKGYAYVPAPWWKTDYFEIRYEDQRDNQRYFYRLDGEGIRNEFLAFRKAILSGNVAGNISSKVTYSMVQILEEFYKGRNRVEL